MKRIDFAGSYAIIPGRKHGQAIGFRTLNFDLEGYSLPVETGIYAGYVTIQNKQHSAVFHYGPRPMIGDEALSFEAHLLDGQLATSPESASIELCVYLRDIQAFVDERALKQQISLDVEEARQALKDLEA